MKIPTDYLSDVEYIRYKELVKKFEGSKEVRYEENKIKELDIEAFLTPNYELHLQLGKLQDKINELVKQVNKLKK